MSLKPHFFLSFIADLENGALLVCSVVLFHYQEYLLACCCVYKLPQWMLIVISIQQLIVTMQLSFLLKTIWGKIKPLIVESPEHLINTVFSYVPYDEVFLFILLILKLDLNMPCKVPDKNHQNGFCEETRQKSQVIADAVV